MILDILVMLKKKNQELAQLDNTLAKLNNTLFRDTHTSGKTIKERQGIINLRVRRTSTCWREGFGRGYDD